MKFVHSQALKIEEVGEAIRQRRKELNITLEKLELISGISRKTLIKLEKGGDVKFSTLTTVLSLIGLHLTFKEPVPAIENDEADWI